MRPSYHFRGVVVDSTVEAAWADFKTELETAGVVIELAEPGLYANSAQFLEVYDGVNGLLDRVFAGLAAERWRFPAVEPKAQFERTDYVASFPQLTAALAVFTGGNLEHAELLRRREETGEWEDLLDAAGLMMCPAACHQLYPVIRGRIPAAGRTFDLNGGCFRREPSADPTRLQYFHQHEYPFAGTADQALAHRDGAGETMAAALRSLGLTIDYLPANDPFFGRAGRMLAKNQRDRALKYEMLCPVYGPGLPPVALGSANYHGDHFALEFGLQLLDGRPAHTSCVGIGLERVVLALFAQHGLLSADWPDQVRRRLWPAYH